MTETSGPRRRSRVSPSPAPPRRALAPAIVLAAVALSLTACSKGGTAAGEGATTPASSSQVAGGGLPSAAPAPGTAGTTAAATPSPTPTQQQLPRGGRTIFPHSVVVMYYGTAGSGVLGVLGEGSPEHAAARLIKAAAPFGRAAHKPVQPAFELITTVASSSPGKDGAYSSYLDPAQVQRYLDVARQHKFLLVLDFQPGRASFLSQVRRYEKFLRQPDVGVALDPEWKLNASQRPLHQIGTTRVAPLNDVSTYLSDLVQRGRLPEKIFMVHQFKAYQIPDRKKIVDRPGLATVLHVDGFGNQGQKFDTYHALASRDRQFVNGFKLFYKADTNLLTPAQALRIKPQPQLFSYQ